IQKRRTLGCENLHPTADRACLTARGGEARRNHERLGAAWIERQRAAFSLVVARLRRAEVRGARDQDAFGIEHTTGLRECREIGLVVDRSTRMKRPDWADGACAWNANGDDARLERVRGWRHRGLRFGGRWRSALTAHDERE